MFVCVIDDTTQDKKWVAEILQQFQMPAPCSVV